MNPLSADQMAALSRINPDLVPYIVIGVPAAGALAWLIGWLPQQRLFRNTMLKLFKWDPGAPPADEVDNRSMQLIDQLQEELRSCRDLVARYGDELEALRLARLSLLASVQEVWEAAVAARAMVHALERRAGVAETAFDPLPRPKLGVLMPS